MNKYLDITKPRCREHIWVGEREETRERRREKEEKRDQHSGVSV